MSLAGCRIQDQYTDIIFFYIPAMSNQKLNFKKHEFYTNLKNYEVLRNKSDKRSERPVYWTIQNIAEIKESLNYWRDLIHESEDSVLLEQTLHKIR